MTNRMLVASEFEGPGDRESVFWIAATRAPAKRPEIGLRLYPDVVRVPRLLHVLHVAAKQQRRYRLSPHRLQRRGSSEVEDCSGEEAIDAASRERGDSETPEGQPAAQPASEEDERRLDKVESLAFEACRSLLEASLRQKNAAAHEQAGRLWAAESAEAASAHEAGEAGLLSLQVQMKREEAIRRLYSETFVVACRESMAQMRERLIRTLIETRELGPVRRRTLREVVDFLMTQGDFQEALQLLEGSRRDFDEFPRDLEANTVSLCVQYASLGATCALLSLGSDSPAVLPSLLRWTNLLDSTVSLAVQRQRACSGSPQPASTPPRAAGEGMGGARDGAAHGAFEVTSRRTRGRQFDGDRSSSDGRGGEETESDRGSFAADVVGPLAVYAAIVNVVKGVYRLRSGDFRAAAEALRRVSARLYSRAFDAALAEDEPFSNGGLQTEFAASGETVDRAEKTFSNAFSVETEGRGGLTEPGGESVEAFGAKTPSRSASVLGVCTPEDVALYTMLCCLASYSRDQLQEQLSEAAPLRSLLALNPVALRAALSFSLSEFEKALNIIQDLKEALECDLLLGEEATGRLIQEIRRNAVRQFACAYRSLTLSTLREAFPREVASTLREDIVTLIERRGLPFRYDRKRDVLWRNERHGIADAVEEAKQRVEDLSHSCQRLCLNVSVADVFGASADYASLSDSRALSRRVEDAERGREDPRPCGRGSGVGPSRPGIRVTQRRTRGRHSGC
ncbi:hypothetical protein BESB_000030 [Besnoitia besnoiti]|uniref:PCI domain-containing protein n=1 Tax=Besnoitia besnoiti TaxID=94643 RepID=A0A2A9MMJ8_BESBE|nr:hypothetical protein BESB_000030 [Besnoitia besnoiti]PFH37661.1 hypothetical protein BESB_000030 [Besnoitia besnoiti]